jgi:hypothetical protein
MTRNRPDSESDMASSPAACLRSGHRLAGLTLMCNRLPHTDYYIEGKSVSVTLSGAASQFAKCSRVQDLCRIESDYYCLVHGVKPACGSISLPWNILRVPGRADRRVYSLRRFARDREAPLTSLNGHVRGSASLAFVTLSPRRSVSCDRARRGSRARDQPSPMLSRLCWTAWVSGSPAGSTRSQRVTVSRSKATASPTRPAA